MKNNQLLPFERNRYYSGKMLTSSDFQAEQTYMNNKRRFVNHMMFGSGIVCGCGVFSLDDLSVLIESGVAIDDYGREIVIDSSVVKKLSSIDGFDKIQTNLVQLCLKYKEDNIHSVYSINHQESGNEYEYNRISEGYELFIKDEEDAGVSFDLEDEFFLERVLFEDEDFRVALTMPNNVCRGRFVKLNLHVEKLSQSSRELSYETVFQMPAFTDLSGRHELKLSCHDIRLTEGKGLIKEYWIKAQDEAVSDAELVIKAGSNHVIKDEKETEVPTVLPMKINILEDVPETLVSREVGKLSLEMRNVAGKQDYICLASLELVKTDSAYIIEKINEGQKNYIAAPSYHKKKSEYMSYFADEKYAAGQTLTVEREKEDNREEKEDRKRPVIATGTLEIPLGDKVTKGAIRYSGEIMHGLGKGNVYVEVGYEHIEDDVAYGANARSTIYGDINLFKKDNMIPDVTTAVKVLNDKGSFVAAARIEKELDFLVLTYRWVAIKFPTNDEKFIEDIKDKSISAVTPTVVLAAKESYFFDVEFHNMEHCSIAYELTEAGNGEITAEGVYTAPMKEGVYEIRIYCTDMPMICTYAYAIVKRTEKEE